EGEKLVERQTPPARLGHDLRRGDLAPEPMSHSPEDLLDAHALRHLVGIGVEIPLHARRLDPEALDEEGAARNAEDVLGAGEALRLEPPRQLSNGGALRQDDEMGLDLA